MSTFQLDTATSRANPTPQPMRRLTVPAIRGRKVDGKTAEPIVMLTAYTARQAQLLDEHCDILLVGDSLGQVIYGLPTTVPVLRREGSSASSFMERIGPHGTFKSLSVAITSIFVMVVVHFSTSANT